MNTFPIDLQLKTEKKLVYNPSTNQIFAGIGTECTGILLYQHYFVDYFEKCQRDAPDSFNLISFQVKSDFRKKGFGTLLVLGLEKLAFDKGLKTIVVDDCALSRDFFVRMGYTITDVPADDEVHAHLKLSDYGHFNDLMQERMNKPETRPHFEKYFGREFKF